VVTVMGVPIKLHATPGAARTAPPRLGQHTAAILEKIAGVKRAAIARLRRDGVV
jgi:crotonobetainyl-CoA:carnitine CoA-transferase CaiB-like acyl-CoA transferase